MPVTDSQGYDGSLNEGGFARMAKYMRGGPSVGSMTDLVVTAGGGDRSVIVAAGEAYGHNVLDTVTEEVVGPMPNVTAWNTIVLRRNWNTNTSSLMYVAGGASEAISAGIEDEPGNIADQPIALVKITAGQTPPTEIVRLSFPWDTGWITIGSSGSPLLYAGGSTASRIVASAGAPAVRRQGTRVEWRGEVKRANEAVLTGTIILGTITKGWRPPTAVADHVAAANWTGGLVSYRLSASSGDGVMTAYVEHNPVWLSLDGLFYHVDS